MSNIKHSARARWWIAMILCISLSSIAQPTINKIEYFYDTDPGFGLGTNVPVTAAVNINALSFSATLGTVTSGFHTLYVRSRTSAGKWSLTQAASVIKYAPQTAGSVAGNVTQLEYFIDNDPGFGLGVNVPITAALDISGQAVNVSLATISLGFHTIYFRSRDVNGKWSLTNTSNFLKYQAQTNTTAAITKIKRLEYFIDTDPGFGLATAIPITAATDINGQAASIGLGSINPGFHTLYIRSMDSLGKWSLTDMSNFIKYQGQTNTTAAITKIKRLEYFIDTDPGFGLATAIPITAATDINGQAASIGLGSLNPGFHTLYIRSMDSLGKWSLTDMSNFIKYQAQTNTTATITKIQRMEYFIDIDPGFGHGYPVAITPATNINSFSFTANIAVVAAGTHELYIRTMDSLGKWSLTDYGPFTGGTLLAPSPVITAVGGSTFCAGTGYFKVNRDYSPTATYQWKRGGTPIQGATDTFFYPTTSGTYTVQVINPAGNTTSSGVTVTVNPSPTATITAGGPLSFCTGGSVTLTVNTTSGATYQWRQNGFNIGANLTSYSATSPGIYTVLVTAAGCGTVSNADTVDVGVAPTASISASGSTNLCTGDSVTLTAIQGGGYTYTWSTASTTQSIIVKSAGNYKVTVTNNGCTSVSNIISVAVFSPPTASITASGSLAFCQGGSLTLNANTGTGLGYHWSNGTNGVSSISVSTSGTFTVTVTNAGSCTAVSNALTTTVTPGPSISIGTTASTICQGSKDTLTASGATTYTWSPATGLNQTTGATVIASPSTTQTYTVSGTISGCTGTALIAVNVTPNHVTASTTTPTICQGSNAKLKASNGTTFTYSWTPSSTLNQATGDSVLATPPNSQKYFVTGTNGTCSSTDSITINVVAQPDTTVTQVGASSFCSGTVLLSVKPTTGATYQWKSYGGVIHGATSTSYTANISGSYTVLVTVGSCSLESSPRVLTYTALPSVSVSAVGVTTFCTGGSVQLNANITGGTVIEWLKNNAPIPSSAGLSSITVTQPGAYTFRAQNAVSCIDTAAAMTVTVNPLPTATIVSLGADTFCAGGSVVLKATKVAGATYQWKNGASNISSATDTLLTVNSTGNYSVVVNSSLSCPATSNVINVTVNQPPSASISSTGSLNVCQGDSVPLRVIFTDPSATYQWYRGSSLLTGATDTVLKAKLTGPYTVSATGANLCSAISNVISVTVNTPPSAAITITGNDTVCGGSVPISVTAVTGASYKWYYNGGLQSSATGSTYFASATGSYTAVVTIGSCKDSSTPVAITILPQPTVSISVSGATTFCTGDSVKLIAHIANGVSYKWYNGSSPVVGATDTQLIVKANGTYYIQVKGQAFCATTSANTVVTVNPLPTATLTVTGSNTFCTGGSVSLSVPFNNNYSYQWIDSGSNINGATTNSYVATHSGVYSVFISGGVNCSVTSILDTVTAYPLPTISIHVTGATTFCTGDSVTLTAHVVNGKSYQWFNGINPVLGAIDTILIVKAGGTYYLKATGLGACTTTSGNTFVTVNPVPNVTLTVTGVNQFCTGGSVSITVPFSSSYTYQWYRDGAPISTANANSYTATQKGIYKVVVSGGANCNISSSTDTVAVYPIPTVSITAQGATSFCQGDSVKLKATGTNISTYQWYKGSNPIPSANADSLYVDSTGSYSLHVVSGSTCGAISNSILVNVSIKPDTTLIVSGATTYCAGTASTTFTLPTGYQSYVWYRNGVLYTTLTTNVLVPTDSGSYYCVIYSNSNCAAQTRTVTLTIKSLPLNTVTATGSLTFCDHDSTRLSADGTGVYLWSNGDTARAVYAKTGGNYTVTITGSNGCSVSSGVLTIVVHSLPNASINASPSATFCLGDSINLSHVATAHQLYTWNTADTGHSIYIHLSGTFTLSVFDSTTGCRATASITTTANGYSIPTVTQTGNTLCTSINGAHYQWYRNGVAQSGDTTQCISMTTSGSYYVIVTHPVSSCTRISAIGTYTYTGIDEIYATISTDLYPNPNTGTFTLTIHTSYPLEGVLMEIYDAIGQRISSMHLLHISDGYSMPISLQDELSTGTYYLHLHNADFHLNKPFQMVR